ncbi:secreted protein [Melampsora americana]|nr:secreted protein [Melampsora americana]
MARTTLFPTLILLFSCYTTLVSGFFIHSPREGEVWDLSDTLMVNWSKFLWDSETFDIQIRNKDTHLYPMGFSKILNKGIQASDRSFNLTTIPELKPGSGFYLEFIDQNQRILARSEKIKIVQKENDSNNILDSNNEDTIFVDSETGSFLDRSSNLNDEVASSQDPYVKPHSGSHVYQRVFTVSFQI